MKYYIFDESKTKEEMQDEIFSNGVGGNLKSIGGLICESDDAAKEVLERISNYNQLAIKFRYYGETPKAILDLEEEIEKLQSKLIWDNGTGGELEEFNKLLIKKEKMTLDNFKNATISIKWLVKIAHN